MTLGENSESTLADLLITETIGDVAQTLKQQDLKLTLQKVFNKKFSPREKDVISMFFGIFGEKQHTLDEIGDKFDLTRERVRQIKEKALKKLKFNSTAAELKEYI